MQPKRPDEIQLYASMREARVLFSTGANIVYGGEIRKAAETIGINENRVFRLIEKWETRGWYEMSSCPPGGWFTETAPERLDACMPR